MRARKSEHQVLRYLFFANQLCWVGTSIFQFHRDTQDYRVCAQMQMSWVQGVCRSFGYVYKSFLHAWNSFSTRIMIFTLKYKLVVTLVETLWIAYGSHWRHPAQSTNCTFQARDSSGFWKVREIWAPHTSKGCCAALWTLFQRINSCKVSNTNRHSKLIEHQYPITLLRRFISLNNLQFRRFQALTLY